MRGRECLQLGRRDAAGAAARETNESRTRVAAAVPGQDDGSEVEATKHFTNAGADKEFARPRLERAARRRVPPLSSGLSSAAPTVEREGPKRSRSLKVPT